MPPPPQVCGAVQVPQSSSPPHESLAGPQFMPRLAQVVGVQLKLMGGVPQTPGVPSPPHIWGEVHVPQSNSPPQPSAAGPQLAPSWSQVAGTHAPPGGTAVPQTLGVPAPPHVSEPVHVPQFSTLPQPSPTGPQFLP